MDLGGGQPKGQGMRGVLCALIAMGLGCAVLGQGAERTEGERANEQAWPK